MLRARLELLDPSVQRLARIASAAGRRVSEPLLRAAVAADGDPQLAAPGAFDAALREAVAHHVLVGEDERIAFRHALLAEAVYTDLLPGEQSSLHRAYLRVLRDDPTLGPSSQLASHALRAPDLPTALRASLDAADQAHEVLAPAEELRHLEVVLRLWEAVPEVTATARRATTSTSWSPRRRPRAAPGRSTARSSSRAPPSRRPRPTSRAQAAPAHRPRAVPAGRGDVHDALEQSSRALADLPDAPTPDRAWALATYARGALNADLDDEAVAQRDPGGRAGAARSGAADAESDALTTLAVLVVDDADRAAELLRTRAGPRPGGLRLRHRAAHHVQPGEQPLLRGRPAGRHAGDGRRGRARPRRSA